MALYGAVPFIHAHSKKSTVGVLNLVASETWVDVIHPPEGVRTHWVSESGILDLLLLPGPRPTDLFEQYATLTGPAQMPPQFATAYHQCRWNYNTQEEVVEVQDEFDKADMPLDVTWLDIEYAEEHRYFDWDHKHFPDPVAMQDYVASKGRKVRAIVFSLTLRWWLSSTLTSKRPTRSVSTPTPRSLMSWSRQLMAKTLMDGAGPAHPCGSTSSILNHGSGGHACSRSVSGRNLLRHYSSGTT